MDKTADIFELLDTDVPPSAAHRARMRTRIRNAERRPDRPWRTDWRMGVLGREEYEYEHEWAEELPDFDE